MNANTEGQTRIAGRTLIRVLVVIAATVGLTGSSAPAPAADYTISCSSDRALIGIRGWQGWWMDGIQGICAKIDGSGALISSDINRTTRAGGTGIGGSKQSDHACPTGYVLTGWKGTRGSYINTIHTLVCKRFDRSTRSATGSATERTAFERKSGTAVSGSCPDSKYGTAFAGAAGIYLDSATLVCGTPALPRGGSPSKQPKQTMLPPR